MLGIMKEGDRGGGDGEEKRTKGQEVREKASGGADEQLRGKRKSTQGQRLGNGGKVGRKQLRSLGAKTG